MPLVNGGRPHLTAPRSQAQLCYCITSHLLLLLLPPPPSPLLLLLLLLLLQGPCL
jgi:hypothetical protein